MGGRCVSLSRTTLSCVATAIGLKSSQEFETMTTESQSLCRFGLVPHLIFENLFKD